MILLDSDVLIALIRRDRKAVDRLREADALGENLATTSLNVAEVLRGEEPGSERADNAAAILQGLVELPCGPRAARRFALLMRELDRAGRSISVIDGLVASIALEEGATLWSRNAREFNRVPGLRFESL